MFSSTYVECLERDQRGFYVNEGYLFKERKFSILQGSRRKILAKETHEGGLMGNFGVEKTFSLLKEKFF